ncbi:MULTISPECIES: tail fiber assembly protein [Photorhabdus]|uniref:Tail fiber assembly protein n=1 Tax=Photorhabdus kayaii TaxID=230088 RepID=A0ABX0B1T0_9GAMM|nr:MULTISPECIES: tail fiber assembly protein [Photorhabdus]MCC8374294.1 tail fiber assembly protein [Photorhabdus bodei]MCT8350535.1 tail fiber assembly protein [Photorhabdus kayaii]MDB6369488.1 tail fiber assembly protein [Photorhabdus bodei]NDL13731.1 tail fiber assembly protein [Photorhabdus kayaii]NDL27061.1 tail fiber assembly protein [Photorhabdus kayaii]
MNDKNYVFSALNKAFYPLLLQQDYIAASSWPNDPISVTDGIFNKFSGIPPAGKILSCGEEGLPCWEDTPPPTKEELISIAESQRTQFISHANEKITPLSDAIELDIATDEEILLLKEWKKYRVMLNRVDTSKAPEIDWPISPLL